MDVAVVVQDMMNVDVIDISSDDDATVTFRGPKIKGKEKFDEYCVFSNRVALDRSQVKHLKEVARKKPTRRVYVCTMQGAHTEDPRAKMYFEKKYSNSFIKKYLNLPRKIKVYSERRCIAKVRVIESKGKGKGVQITSSWKKVVERTGMEEGEVFLFWFRGCSERGLKLIVERVE